MNKKLIMLSICFIFFAALLVYGFFNLDGTSLKKPLDSKIYSDLLTKLKAQGYSFILSREYNGSTASKTVLVFHDCDFSFDGLKTLINIEETFGVRSTIFVRPNTEYFESAIPYLSDLQNQGWEIGYHYDTLSKTQNTTLALQVFKAQLALLRTFFNVEATRPHGDVYNLEVYNGDLYNATVWQRLGLREMIITEPNQYATDTDKKLSVPQTFNSTLVIIAFHSDWWG